MSFAFFDVLPSHLMALKELAEVARGPRKTISAKDHAPPTNNFLRRFRQWLYDFEKALGDIIPYGNLPGLSGPREAALGGARFLGDLQSVLSRTMGSRVVRRLTGRVTGRLIGIGANTVFASQRFSVTISPLNRLYNREAGKYLSRFVGQSNTLSGRF